MPAGRILINNLYRVQLNGNLADEVLTACKTKRESGASVKHLLKENWIKIYDKFGLVLRVETVINSPPVSIPAKK